MVKQIGIDSFAAAFDERSQAVDPSERLRDLVGQIALADRVGLDVFGIGEHHRREFLDSAPTVILGAAAARTSRIRLTSAVTVLSAADPVRVFQEFATLDLLSAGRAEMVVGRGSSVEAFPLFGYDLADYDALFAEKLDLLLKLREEEHPHWSGQFRPALTGQGVYPRPVQDPLPIWLGGGGTPGAFARAAGVVRAARRARPAPGGRDHRRRAASLPPADRPLPRGRPARRVRGRSAHGRRARARVRRPDDRAGDRGLLPGLRPGVQRHR